MNANSKIKSPFKFLEAFEKNDETLFFGRQDETLQLYKTVRSYRSVVVYGPSGSGKTSLIQCGLANYLDPTDWFPILLRRGKSFTYTLSHFLKNEKGLNLPGDEEVLSIDEICHSLETLSKIQLRPIHLIFDQFEELLILGLETELLQITDLLNKILHLESLSCCNLIISIREEYIGQLESFGSHVPGLLDKRVRLEPMSIQSGAEVIRKSCEKFNITFDPDGDSDGDSEGPELIAKILGEKGIIQLPYLQVYLDQFWREDFARTYPDPTVAEAQVEYPALQFTNDEIIKFGELSDIIHRFIEEQLFHITEQLKVDFPAETFYPLEQILDAFVTNEGTKKPIEFKRGDNKLLSLIDAPDCLHKYPEVLLSACLEALEDRRILRQNDKLFELTHDKIAELIFLKRTPKAELVQQLKSRAETNEFLTVHELIKYEDYLPNLNFDEKVENFVYKSKTVRTNERNRKKKAAITLLAIVLIVLFGIWLNHKNYENLQMKASIFLNQTVDTITNKETALLLANHVYNWKQKEEFQKPLEESFLSLFKIQDIQSKLSLMYKNLPLASFKQGDFDISDDGEYLVVKVKADPEKTEHYRLFNKSGDSITTFTDRINYVYFLNKPDILLVACTTNSDWRSSLYTAYPNFFYLYNCREKRIIPLNKENETEVRLQNDFLYPKTRILRKQRSDTDSYFIRFTADGKLVVPAITLNKQNKFEGILRIYENNKLLERIPVISTVSLSRDKKSLMFNYVKEGRQVMGFRNFKAPVILKDLYFAEFMSRGSVIYIRDGKLVVMSPNGDTSRQLIIDSLINYAHPSSDEKFALVTKQLSKNFFIADLAAKRYKEYNETLIGFNLDSNVFFSYKAHPTNNKATVIYRNPFSSSNKDSIILGSRILQTAFNARTNSTLVLDTAYKLHVYSHLKRKTIYQLSANDLFGFSGNGEYIYYIRDASLNLVKNSDDMINIDSVSAAQAWLKSSAWSNKKLSPTIIKRYLPEGSFSIASIKFTSP